MKRLADQTLYEILDVREDAPEEEIRAACERALLLYGPGSLATYTLLTPDEAALLTSRIEEARTTLLDPGARARYDEQLQHAPAGVAAAAGVNGVVEPLPPVIPAAAPPAPPAGAGAPAPSSGEAEGQPAILLAAAVEAAGSTEVAVRPKPILLERAVSPAASPPAPPAQAPARPVAEPAEPVAVPTPAEGEGWSGEALRKVREARGLSVQQLAERTKVTRHHLENIEADRFGALPAPVYLRGILVSLARELRLDGQKVARSYLDRAAAGSKR